ncbi:hypothetical protein ACFXB3_04795 [Streptomyces sp. NPDC059447]|uniref:hypothetical protein n=1 Tax=Streptomyces sp. NPDC059447 TaxID=3346834 RepID=UPI0036C846AA
MRIERTALRSVQAPGEARMKAVTAVLARSALTAAGGVMYALRHDGFSELVVGLAFPITGLVVFGSGTVKR